jgi:uncharacterized protein YhbP (UPF0306 family)
MDQRIIDFLNSQRICVLSVEMMDGSPHGSTLHFAINENPLTFLFQTSRSYRKCEPFFGKDKTRASIVVGVDESNMRTLQIDGEAKLMDPSEEELFNKTYYNKFPEKNKPNPSPDVVKFSFTPTWWRYTDWTSSEGKLVLISDNK